MKSSRNDLNVRIFLMIKFDLRSDLILVSPILSLILSSILWLLIRPLVQYLKYFGLFILQQHFKLFRVQEQYIYFNFFNFTSLNWGLPCNNSIGAWRYLLSLFSSDEMIGNLTDNLNTEFSPKKICRCRGSKTAQNWSSKLFSAMRIFYKKN